MKPINPGESFLLDTTQPCPSCGKDLDSAFCATDPDARPKNGDLNICFYCGHFMSYNDDGSFRELTEIEMYEIAGNPDIIAIMKAMAAAKISAANSFNSSDNASSSGSSDKE